ncbi:hypothetical protein DPMN_170845 [Dreissena polymorpha]|uniref:Uncharacterized protein n=1 Tax=Dreissena polymorpha TaxID=45954 RepID=A0A9D4DWX5_DREPO|nr:hypothetical protein DPMN_170845 [Dreissena polymorpha]
MFYYQLLPRLHDIAIQSEMSSSPVAVKLREISKELTAALETQMQVRKIDQTTYPFPT